MQKQNKKYKPNDSPFIPKGWELKSLGELGTFSKGNGITKEQLSPTGLPCIRYGEIYTSHDYFIKQFRSFISDEVAKESRQICKNDILLAGSGETLEDIGKAIAYIGSEEAYAGGDVIIFTPNGKTDSIFLSYFLNTNFSNRQKRRLGQGHSVVHIYPYMLEGLKIFLPPLSEQKQIRDILFTWNKTIELTEKLIISKEKRKQALMQQLLTGKKRLKGFSGKWKEVRLGSVCDLVNGMAFKPEEWTTIGVPIIRIQNLNGSKVFNYYDKKIEEKYYVKNGDLLFAWSGSRGTSFGSFKWEGKLAVLNQHIFNIHPKNGLSKDFTFQLLRWLTIGIERRAHGSAGLVHVTKKQLEHEKMKIPQSSEEQIAIAEMLSAADKEIQLVKNKLEKLKEQKRGLTQTLLMGKKRVKI